MSPPSAPSPPDSTGPPDRQTLRLLEKHFASDPLVTETVFEPDTHEPRLLRIRLDVDRYPESVEIARLDGRWFANGDFSIHYAEADPDGSAWECRWDRYPNDHNTRVHFHRPPDGDEIEDLSLPSTHPLDVYSIVLAAVERRIETR